MNANSVFLVRYLGGFGLLLVFHSCFITSLFSVSPSVVIWYFSEGV